MNESLDEKLEKLYSFSDIDIMKPKKGCENSYFKALESLMEEINKNKNKNKKRLEKMNY